MTKAPKHKWTFAARFRYHAFGWRSQPAIERVKEAVSEIKAAARQDMILGAEGAILLLEKLSPALEQVDSSSGAIGSAVNNAIETLVPIIAQAPSDETTRSSWLDRLWKAVEEDAIPYIEILPEYWGVLCRTQEMASHWGDELIIPLRHSWSQDRRAGGGYFKGTSACLSALCAAGRYPEVFSLLDLAPYKFWSYRQWGVKALIAMGKQAEALRYAEESRGINEPVAAIAAACEQILLDSGMADEAYRRYAITANQKTTYLATFRAIAKKYPQKTSRDILADLVAKSPGNEGKWFAAAKSAGLYSEAIELANRTPCDPKTLIRAARDMKSREPRFAVEAGVTALRWLAAGYGYEITGFDVREAYQFTMEAARNAGCEGNARERIRAVVASDPPPIRMVSTILSSELGMLVK
ncbi:MAG: hypothetical protein A2511_11440 [Deltaproteobacteria bacterium RIFOXYD12_FULL_50_9]|nr:MAG: hypothetical protein A2511_11440 [Deltaproteobacteria bacterium RIFOXYD12_FULL_50_9]